MIYNEIDPGAAAWLKGLVDAGRIASGSVDSRSIEVLGRSDVDGPGQRHFFAGIGGWSLALRYAGIPDDADIWTGSCPCQPFSQAGRRKGNDDARHLWPTWFRLIEECRPPIVFGEQVASAAGFDWLSSVRADLEAAGYAVGGADLPACSVGAPHKRQRLFFVAYADSERLERLRVQLRAGRSRQDLLEARWSGEAGVVEYADGLERERDSRGRREEGRWLEHTSDVRDVGNASSEGSGRDAGAVPRSEAEGDRERIEARRVVDVPFAASPTRGYWQHADWLLCRDGKARAVEPGTFPLVAGLSVHVERLRALEMAGREEVISYGNAVKRDSDEILRAVRSAVLSSTCWQEPNSRMRQQLPAPEVLLAFLFCIESTRDGSVVRGSVSKASSEAQHRIVRGVRFDDRDRGSPRRREPVEQRPEQSANSLLTLSFVLARYAEAHRASAYSAHAASGRAGMIRGYGNAVNPILTAEFISAALEAITEG